LTESELLATVPVMIGLTNEPPTTTSASEHRTGSLVGYRPSMA